MLPNLLVPEIARALEDAKGYRIYISNVATQRGETNCYSAADHYAALRRHLGVEHIADIVLANSNLPAEPLPEEWRSQPVVAPGDADYGGARLVLADLVDHDPDRLASQVMRLYFERDIRVAVERVEALTAG